ncbi:MAG TPA: nitronate monooxygenase [Kofleriaceae bacterium]|nr:nitronate monooxygenase [Kofleriaceae bacterium]
MTQPEIIQGGMGIGVSTWRLARAVAQHGHLGVVSGAGSDTILVRQLQDGDPGGHLRRSIARFPLPGVAAETLRRYFLPEGRPPGTPYRLLSLPRQVMSVARQQLVMLSTFVQVDLAKEGHDGQVGMNLLAKIQAPTLPALYGAMLAGVDVILMGAGIPREIPGALDALAEHRACAIRFDVENLPAGHTPMLTFDPAAHWAELPAPLRRPAFLAIVASNSLATMLSRKANGRVDGFVIEGPTAGGHNAPPRGELHVNARGEPVYGPRDEVDLGKLAELGLPFWLAGGAGSPEGLARARAAGAAGIQVGTLFAFCDESGIAESLRRSVLAHARSGELDVRTDARASPTGYPFKIVDWPANPATGRERERVCDLGALRVAYADADGTIGYRCPGEPIDQYLAKGGKLEDTVGRRCLCNSLTATVGLGQLRDGGSVEPPLVTSGDDLVSIGRFLGERTSYSAADVLAYLQLTSRREASAPAR